MDGGLSNGVAAIPVSGADANFTSCTEFRFLHVIWEAQHAGEESTNNP